jgi:hypothetical protein
MPHDNHTISIGLQFDSSTTSFLRRFTLRSPIERLVPSDATSCLKLVPRCFAECPEVAPAAYCTKSLVGERQHQLIVP